MKLAIFTLLFSPVLAFTPYLRSSPTFTRNLVVVNDGKLGIFFGTSTGSTESVAEMIKDEFGSDAVGPIDIDSIQGNVATEFAKYDALIVGTPTWNTGADSERSGTGWDEVYYGEMQDLNIAGKKVAVFGLGDSVSYAENYADASGELHDVFEGLGCKMMGYVSQDGYEHEASKAIRGDLFCGLLLDAVNQEELTPERVENWVVQLKEEGILEGGSTVAAASPAVVATPVVAEPVGQPLQEDVTATIARLERENAELKKILMEVKESTPEESFEPYVNAMTGRTMWVSSDGRSCYYTAANASP